MTDPLRPTRPVVELIDCADETPTPGSRVLAIGLGGTLAPIIWTSESSKFFKAWMPYPKIPQAVKDKLMEQYK